MKIPSVLKDRRVQLAAAGAGVIGLVVLVRRGGTVTGAGGDEGQSGSYIQPAQFDSTGTDVYNAIQSIGQGWSNDLREFTDQITDMNDKLDKLAKPGTPPTTPAPSKPVTGKPVPPPKPSTPAKPAPARPAAEYAIVTRFTSRNPAWSSTLSGIASHYKTSVSNIMRLNPQIKNANIIHPNQRIRVR